MMRPPLRVTRWQATATDQDTTTISAEVDGVPVWFRSAHFATAPETGDPYLAIALLAAMALHRDLDLGDLPPISPRLLDTVPDLLDLWTQWNPLLARIDVTANRGTPASTAPGTGTFFSGGIDAVHAALDGGDVDGLLVFINGFDFVLSPEQAVHSMARLERLNARLGGHLVQVETNWVTWRRNLHLSGALMHGGVLAACAHLSGVGRMTVASSNSFARLTPWGSHTLADPLWSTDRTTIRHWGAHCSRADKVVRLAAEPDLREHIWVCHEQPVGNCGRCAKCARTRLAFHLAGAALPVEPDAAATDPLAMYLPHLSQGSEHVYVAELTELADRGGNRRAGELLRRGGRKLARRQLLRDLRNAVLPGMAARRMARADLQPWGRGPAPRPL